MNDDFQWIKDIDGISHDLAWNVTSSWHSKRLNRKFRDAIKTWVHPTHLIKILRVYGNIDREFNSNRLVWIRIDTTVGRLMIQGGFVNGEEVYIVDFYRGDVGVYEFNYVHTNMTPKILMGQLNLLGSV